MCLVHSVAPKTVMFRVFDMLGHLHFLLILVTAVTDNGSLIMLAIFVLLCFTGNGWLLCTQWKQGTGLCVFLWTSQLGKPIRCKQDNFLVSWRLMCVWIYKCVCVCVCITQVGKLSTVNWPSCINWPSCQPSCSQLTVLSIDRPAQPWKTVRTLKNKIVTWNAENVR